ncbi:hypothetical protein Tco_1091968 [Tanacetum coccineum]|uniref:Uncharacterized protein n=1 Tax=Tanacetum coccineum TaxID=301880 RepID=A0ABQ5I9V2_9ASTR
MKNTPVTGLPISRKYLAEEEWQLHAQSNPIVEVTLGKAILAKRHDVTVTKRKDLFETKAKGRSDGKAKEKILCSVIGGFGVDSATLSL